MQTEDPAARCSEESAEFFPYFPAPEYGRTVPQLKADFLGKDHLCSSFGTVFYLPFSLFLHQIVIQRTSPNARVAVNDRKMDVIIKRFTTMAQK